MITYEELKDSLSGLNPDEYSYWSNLYETYIDTIRKEFHKEYNYCTGCRKMIKIADLYEKIEGIHRLTICKHCDTIWFVRSINNK